MQREDDTAYAMSGVIAAMERLPVESNDRLAEGMGLEAALVTYLSQGLKVKAYMVKPQGDGIWPGLVYCRGGIGRVGMLRLPRMMTLAARGYVVFAPVYRGNLGGERRDEFGGEDRHDVFAAIAALRSLPYVAPGRVPLIGFSRGAVMALLAAAHCPDAGPVAVWGGVSDLLLTYEERVDLRRMLRRVVGHPKKEPEQYARRSPVAWASHITAPVLMLHGTNDEQVGVEHARRLAAALTSAGKPHTLRIYDGLGHLFPEEEDKQALNELFAWFKRYDDFGQDGGGITNE